MGVLTFAVLLGAGAIYAMGHLVRDLAVVKSDSVLPFLFLAVALMIARGFEFVNGFHDTANAVATVIYTHSLEPHIAVAWSGLWNFTGVLVSSGAVAFAIVSLLPVELLLQVGSSAGFAMVFSLLIAAMKWNLGTWYFGLPASSSHTLIGSVIGVGIANELMATKTGRSGVDWAQAGSIGKTLLVSPLFGFMLAGLLLIIAKALIKQKKLYEAPQGTEPPPLWIRSLLILTCTGVSFAHGSNDGQKGMGLIMLILIGIVPTAYALNRAIPPAATQDFVAVSRRTTATLNKYVSPNAIIGDAHDEIADYIKSRKFTADTMLALRQIVNNVGNEMESYSTLSNVPDNLVRNFRNDMYLTSEAFRLMKKSGQPAIRPDDWKVLDNYKAHIDKPRNSSRPGLRSQSR